MAFPAIWTSSLRLAPTRPRSAHRGSYTDSPPITTNLMSPKSYAVSILHHRKSHGPLWQRTTASTNIAHFSIWQIAISIPRWPIQLESWKNILSRSASYRSPELHQKRPLVLRNNRLTASLTVHRIQCKGRGLLSLLQVYSMKNCWELLWVLGGIGFCPVTVL